MIFTRLNPAELGCKAAFNWVNPVRAGLVDRPEEYRWSSLGYRFRTSHKDEFLSWNLGLKEYNVKSPKDRLRLYREFVYARGGVDLDPVKSCLQQGRSAAFNRASKGKILDAVPLPESVEHFIQRARFFTRLNRPPVYGDSRA
ncbi:MAG: hypothetical protein ACQEUB_15090 [Thermodesulfobacteriota bacterium]